MSSLRLELLESRAMGRHDYMPGEEYFWITRYLRKQAGGWPLDVSQRIRELRELYGQRERPKNRSLGCI